MRHEIGNALLLTGDCLEVLRWLPALSVQTCVTSPPYYGLRDYGHDGQIGLEPTPDEYVARLVEVFREVRRVLADDGTLWLNMGDSYAGSWGNAGGQNRGSGTQRAITDQAERNGDFVPPGKYGFADIGIKPKDLLGIPWRVAFALQADGWYLRQEIIWSKPNPMPESVRDRCTKSHEQIFLLSKAARYYYDQDAIAEGIADSTIDRLSQDIALQAGSARVPGKTNGPMKAVGSLHMRETQRNDGDRWREAEGGVAPRGTRNRRSVWTVATQPYSGAHFATFPPALIEPCILAGCPAGGTVLDPFSGSGTTGQVALQQGRKYLGIELNPEYQALAIERITPHAAQERLFA